MFTRRPPIGAAVVIAAFASGGCLAKALAVDTETVDVVWTFASDDFGCTQDRVNAPDLPEVRIRAHVNGAPDDDELFDIVPCVDESGLLQGSTTPLALGAYQISLELWTRFGGQVIGRSVVDGVVILSEPGMRRTVELVIEPVD
jgi:hypothetical protein